jgi:hypothetical protein
MFLVLGSFFELGLYTSSGSSSANYSNLTNLPWYRNLFSARVFLHSYLTIFCCDFLLCFFSQYFFILSLLYSCDKLPMLTLIFELETLESLRSWELEELLEKLMSLSLTKWPDNSSPLWWYLNALLLLSGLRPEKSECMSAFFADGASNLWLKVSELSPLALYEDVAY